MDKTQNFGMSLPDLSNNADINVLNENFNNIDKGLAPFFIATTTESNVYKIDTGLNKTSLENGYCIRVAIPENSTNEVNILLDALKIPVKKSGGGSVSNFKADSVYSLTYYNSVFILTSSGGGDEVNFTSDKLLEGYTANNSDGEKIIGTMKNNGDIETALNAGGSFIIPQGYHGGQGKVIANSLSSQTVGNATSEQILQGYSAWANGQKIDGNISSKGATTYTPSNYNQVISEGQYLSGSQTILGDINLMPENIKQGVSIFGVNGSVKRCVSGECSLSKITRMFVDSENVNRYLYYLTIPINFSPKYIACFEKTGSLSTATFCRDSGKIWLSNIDSSSNALKYSFDLEKNTFIITSTELVIPVAKVNEKGFYYVVTE